MSNRDSNSFDSIMDAAELENAQPIKPLYTVEKGDATSKWVKNAFPALMKQNSAYFEEIDENLRLYKGNILNKEKTTAGSRATSEESALSMERARNTKLYVNRIHDLVEWRVTTHNASKPGIDIGPANVEYEDRIGAKVAKAVYDTVAYEQDEDAVERQALRNVFLAGEHYVGVLWNPDKGDLHPEYVKATKNGKKLDIKYDGPIRIGDVELKHFPAWRVLPEPAESADKRTWHMTWEAVYLDDAKLRYKGPKAKLLNPLNTNAIEGFDSDFLRKLQSQDKVILITVWAKRCKYMPNGRYIVSTFDGTILEDRDLPYQHDEHPLVCITDLDMPTEPRGLSFIRNIKGLQYQDFFITSMMAANMRLIGYPKWQIEQNSINIKDLANARTVVQRRPGSAPAQLTQPQSIPSDIFGYKESGVAEMTAFVKGNFSTPQSLPARIDSAVALQYLKEEDSQRNHTMFSKVAAFRVKLAQLILSVAGEYYDADDKRLIRIVGQNNEYDVRYFDVANLNRPYDIRVRSGSALPEGRAARTQTIIELNEKLPGLFTNQQILDMLDLGSTEKLFDVGTKALRAAESIVQDILTGKPVPPPDGTEDLVVYWNTLMLYAQDRQFKDAVPPEVKQNLLDYLLAVEMLMFERAEKSPAFGQLLMNMPLYPVLFTPPPPPPPPMPVDAHEAAEGAGQEEAMEEGEEQAPPVDPQALSAEEVNAAHDYMKMSVEDSDLDDENEGTQK